MSDTVSTTSVESSPTPAESAPTSPSDGHAALGAEVDAMFGYSVPATEREPDHEIDEAPSSPSSEAAPSTTKTDTPVAGAPPAETSQSTTTQEPAAEATDDPLKDATALTYMVDGQPRTDERIKVVKDLGAVIDNKDLPYIQQRLSERDHLYERNQAQYRELSALQSATTWKDGDKTLTGIAALEAQRVYIVQAAETIKQFADIMTPANFAKYVAIGQNPDGTYFVEPDKAALEAFRERLAFVTDRAAFNARRAFAPIAQSFPAAPPAAQAAPDTPVESMASGTVDALATDMKVTLSPESKQFLIDQLPRYVRATTAEERAQFGPRIVDFSFRSLIEREAKAQQSVQAVATAATTAAKNNAPKLAAALTQRPAVQRPAARRPAPAEETLSPEEEAYLRFERSAASAIRARSA